MFFVRKPCSKSKRVFRPASLIFAAAFCTLSGAVKAQVTLASQTYYLIINPNGNIGTGNTGGTAGFTEQTDFGTASATGQPPNGQGFINAAQYNPSQHLYAQLENVAISFQITNITQTYLYTNTTGTGTNNEPQGPFTSTLTARGLLFEPSTITAIASSSATTVQNGTGSGITLPANGNTYPTNGIAGSVNPTANIFTLNDSNLVTYTGSGNVSFDVSGIGSNSLSGTDDGNISSAITTVFGAYVTITYTIATPVPEPSSLAIIGLGCLSTGLYIRRRKSNTTTNLPMLN